MNEDRQKAFQLLTAETMGFQCFLDTITAYPTKDTEQNLRKLLRFWKIYMEEIMPKLAKEARAPVQQLCDQITRMMRPSSSKSRSVTKKLKQEGGVRFGQIVVAGKTSKPSKNQTYAIQLARKAGMQLGVLKSEQEQRLEQMTLAQVDKLQRMMNRLVAKGDHKHAAMIQVTIDGIVDNAQLFPALPRPLIAAVTAFLVYKTPAYISAIVSTILSISVGLPAGVTAAAGGGAVQAAKNLFGPSETTAGEAATAAAAATGKAVAGFIPMLLKSVTPDEATQLGHLVGLLIFIPLILMSMLKYNQFVSSARTSARKERVEAFFELDKKLKSLEGEAGATGVPLLKNVADLDAGEKRNIERKIDEIYSHFDFTKDEKLNKVSSDEFKRLLKDKYKKKLISSHPNHGGSEPELTKTRELYAAALDILGMQGAEVNAENVNPFANEGGGRRKTQRLSRRRS